MRRPERLLPAAATLLVALGCATTERPEATYPQGLREPASAGSVSAPPAALRPATPAEASSPPAAKPEPARRGAPKRPRIAGDERVGIEFRDTPIADAFRLIADQAGVNFVVPEGVSGSISASLPSVTLDQALDVVLEQAGAELALQDGVYSVRPRLVPERVSFAFQPRSGDVTVLQQQLDKMLSQSGATYTVNADANVVYVSVPPDREEEVKRLLEAMDASPRQVLIEARILEVALDEDFEFGVAATLDQLSVGDSTTSILTDFLRDSTDFQLRTLADRGKVDVLLQALQKLGRLHVIASPRVLAVNQRLAKIEIIENVPYIDSTATTTTTADGSGVSTIQQVEFEEVGIKLHVTPVLGQGKRIKLQVLQEVSEVVDFFNTVPVTDSRTVDTTLVVDDRQTIVIGGLLKERTKHNRSGVPLLMDLPLLGRFFSGEDVTREKVELLVFLTPRIVSAGEVQGVSGEYKRELMRKSREYGQPYREFLDDVEH